ncbi:MAG: GAF domain-containing protein, partial [Actinomycetota bacterium]|nr:GAF domain-containing protein [Actinomycetota bacterium]
PESVLTDADRLAAVEALRPELSEQEGLDRFTLLASKILEVPVSTITLIDRDRQIFASQVGVSEPWASAGEVSLEYSYCQYAVTSREPLRIDDANRHPLVQGSPAIDEMNVVSYLGIPLITDDDQAVGSLCAIDSRPRHWTDHEVSILNDLAEILLAQLNATRRTPGRHALA